MRKFQMTLILSVFEIHYIWIDKSYAYFEPSLCQVMQFDDRFQIHSRYMSLKFIPQTKSRSKSNPLVQAQPKIICIIKLYPCLIVVTLHSNAILLMCR